MPIEVQNDFRGPGQSGHSGQRYKHWLNRVPGQDCVLGTIGTNPRALSRLANKVGTSRDTLNPIKTGLSRLSRLSQVKKRYFRK